MVTFALVTDTLVSVNEAHVVSVTPYGCNATLHMDDGSTYVVRESLRDVVERLSPKRRSSDN